MIPIFKKSKTTRASFIINTLGMGVAIAALYILAVQVHYMFTYNRNLPDHEHIFIMTSPSWSGEGQSASMNRPYAERMIADLPEIAIGGEFGSFGSSYRSYNLQPEGEHGSAENGFPRNMNTNIVLATKATIEIFGYEFLQGSWTDIEGDDHRLAISKSLAKKFDLQVGDIIQENTNSGKRTCEIVAIFKNTPKNTDLEQFEVMCDIGNQDIDSWGEHSYNYYVKPIAGLTPNDLNRAAEARLRKGCTESGFFPEWLGQAESDEDIEYMVKTLKLSFTPIADTYFSKITGNNLRHGSKAAAYGWLAIGLLILFVAIINYINMFFALVPIKIRSINTRKILGSSRFSLTASVVSESVVMTIVSIGLAAVIVLLLQGTTYASLMDCSLSMVRNAGVAVLCAIGAIVVAVCSSLYPALYITSFEPAFALKANFGASQSGRTLRYILVMVQFTVAIAFIILSIFVDIQGRFLINHDMGFNRENIIVAQVSNKVGNETSAVESMLKQSPQIKDIAWGDGHLVFWGRMSWGQVLDGNQCMWEVYPCSWNMLDFLGIEITEGRNFTKADEQTENGVFIFNETARHQFNLTLDKLVPGHHNNTPTEIAGFCKDFNAWPMSQSIRPYCFYVWGDNKWRPCTTLLVRTTENSNLRDAFSHIEQTIMNFDPSLTPEDIDVHLFDTDLHNMYIGVENFAKLTRMLSVIAIIIAMLGVFGLVLFETEYRRKEIGIRRVNGATIFDVLKMFNSRYVLIVLTCFGIAAPLSYIAISSYLQQFTYRTAIHWWVFVVALLAVMTITIVIVTLRSLRAAIDNPVESLRSE